MNSLFEDLSIRPVTRHLVEALLVDLPLTPAASVDFGVASATHYRALREVLEVQPEQVRGEDEEDLESNIERELRTRIVALEQALGNGAAINALVKRYAPQYAEQVRFQTSWDPLAGQTTAKQPK
jgi:hypothetical protein